MPSPDSQEPVSTLTAGEAYQALEAFVVDNDDLLLLEERLGRFNIFDALGIVRAEIRHSNFLAWLLDPVESHGAGQLFLRPVLMDMLRQAPHSMRPMSPVEIDGHDLGGVEIRREADHIDILISCEDPKLVVAIENKIDSSEHSDQLSRYREVVARKYPVHAALFVFLTREGDEPTDEAWSPYSYADLFNTLSRTRRMNANAIGDDVLAFLDHYLRMIGSRFMDDPKIDELCERIYRNHRQALDLIFERRGDPRNQIALDFQQALLEDADYWHTSVATYKCQFMPKDWINIVPPIAQSTSLHPTAVFRGVLSVQTKAIILMIRIGATTDEPLRRRLVDAIKASDIGVPVVIKTSPNGQWVQIRKREVLYRGSDMSDEENLYEIVRAAARKMRPYMEPFTPILKDVFCQ